MELKTNTKTIYYRLQKIKEQIPERNKILEGLLGYSIVSIKEKELFIFRDRDTPPFRDRDTPPFRDRDTPPFRDRDTPSFPIFRDYDEPFRDRH